MTSRPCARALRDDLCACAHRALVALTTEARIGSGSARSEGACGADEGTGLFDVGRAVAIGEEAVVADAGEARRDDVHEEAAEEFEGRKVHRLAGIAVVIVAIPERDPLAVEGEDALVRDRDSARVRGQIGQDLLGPAEGRLDVAVPVGLRSAGEQKIERGPIRAMWAGLRAIRRHTPR
jgi:hypothetical protein